MTGKITHRRGVPVLGDEEQSRRAKIARRKRVYGMAEDEFRSRLRVQENRCRVCADEFVQEPYIDHDHGCCPSLPACGLCNRGLLCSKCNCMLGLARDRPELLRAAAEYLEKYK